MNNNKIKSIEKYVESLWGNIHAIENLKEVEKELNGKVSKDTKLYYELAVARWATAHKILEFLNDNILIEEMK